MKKILFSLTAILSVASFSSEKNLNVYVGAGLNYLNSPYSIEWSRVEDPTSQLKTTPEDNTEDALSYLEANAFIDSIKENKKSFFNFKNFNTKIELTKNYNDNLEFGAGVRYISNDSIEQSISLKDYNEAFVKNLKHLKDKNLIDSQLETKVKQLLVDDSSLKDIGELKVNIKNASYDTIPLYATLKYNFHKFENFTPYLKADLGLAINTNVRKNSLTYDIKKSETGEQDNVNKVAEILEETKLSFNDQEIKAKNGIFTGLTLGTEYKNFFAEVGAFYVGGSIDEKNGDEITNIKTGDFKAIANVGLKF